MTPDGWTIIGTGLALAALIVTSFRSLRADLRTDLKNLRTELKADIKALDDRVRNHGERMAKLEGLLEGLREAISGRRAA